MALFKLLYLVTFIIFYLKLVYCQYIESPCPDVFDYAHDGGKIYGRIFLKPSAPVSELVVKVNLTVATQIYNTYLGHIEAIDENLVLQKYNRGMTVQYRIHFPVTSPLPKLTALTVNEDLICYGPGDVPRPHQYVTTLSLRHIAFLHGGDFNFRPQQFNAPEPMPAFTGHFGDDTKVYTFSNTSDSSPSFNNINSTMPHVQPTQPVYKPSRPAYEQPAFEDQNQFSPVYNRNQQIPPYDMNQDMPILQQPESSPMYKEPTTKPPRPIQNIPEPSTTRRPMYQPPPAQSDSECGIVSGGNEKLPLVYNGNSYTRGDLPWLVAIYRNTGSALSFICGGTLVSNRHVVSAAHCMQLRSEITSVKDIVVKVGVHNLNDWGDDLIVTRNLMSAHIHESYNSSTLENDILVLTLNKRVEFNTYIRAACLWSGNTELSRIVGASGVVAGWGDQGLNEARPGEPQMVRLPIVSTAMCRASNPDFHKITFSTTFCAGDRNGAGPCRGDSGGGLYLLDSGKWRLRGVVSIALRPNNGFSTCDLNQYVVFTDTAQYLSWIRQIISIPYFD